MRLRYFLMNLMVCCSAFAQNLYVQPTSEVIVRQFDDGDRDAASINAMITAIPGDRQVTAVFDGGPWTVDANVSFPSNLHVLVTPGSQLNVDSGKVVTMNGSAWMAGNWATFGGAGTATGTAYFVHRYTVWGDTNRFDIGDGILDAEIDSINATTWVQTNASHWYDAGTTQFFDKAYADDFTAVDGVFSNLYATNISAARITSADAMTLNGTVISNWSDVNPFSLIGYAGYTNLTLGGHQVVQSGATAVGSAALIATNTFANAFDGVTNTFTGTGAIDPDWGAAQQLVGFSYKIDLGSTYHGFVEVHMQSDGDEDARQSSWGVSATDKDVDCSIGAGLPLDGIHSVGGSWVASDSDGTDDVVVGHQGMSFTYTDFANGGTVNDFEHSSMIMPFVGRYIILYGSATGAEAGKNIYYRYSVIKVYGAEI